MTPPEDWADAEMPPAPVAPAHRGLLSRIPGRTQALASAISLLLIVALPSLPKYWGRVVFVAALGVFAIFAVRVVDGVFHNLPIRWTVNLALDTAITWVLTGLVLAAIVRPSKDSA